MRRTAPSFASPMLPAIFHHATLGIPNVDGLESDLILSPSGAPYLRRFHVLHGSGYHVRYHEWLASDEQDALHDHAWDNISLVLAGQLRERTENGTRDLAPGDLVCRPAEQAHAIELISSPAWTLFLTLPARRRWGFHTEHGWVHWREYGAVGRYAEPPASRVW